MVGEKEVRAVCPVCSSAAVFRCTSCKEVSYCSKEHQKMDWKQHKNSCKAYEIRTSEKLGRYLVASRDLSPGDIVITETPLIWGPKALYDPERIAPCVGCYKPVNLDVGERCASCGWPICSGHCQGLKDHRHHGLECVVLSLRSGCAVSDMGDYYRHDALFALRCLISQTKFQKKYKKILELQSHIEDRGPDTEIYRETDALVAKYLEDNFLFPLRSVETQLKTNLVPDISDNLIHKICGIIDVNALDINLNNGCEISALYATACMMEHSCISNTKHCFNLTSTDENSQYRITVKAVAHIAKGENITTMYSHALWGTQARRDHLKETKYFSCFCKRCKDPTELGTYLSTMKCIGTGKESCGGYQLPDDPCDDTSEWSCDKCPVTVKSSEIRFLISKLGEDVENMQVGRPNIQQMENFLEKLSTFLHPHHYHVYSVKHSLVQLYGYQNGYLHHEMKLEDLEKKANMCQELIDITAALDPGNSRLSLYTGVLYHELFQAKFEVMKRDVDNKLVDKQDNLRKLDELKVCLKTALNALEDELDGSPGQRLMVVMKESEGKFLKWIKKK